VDTAAISAWLQANKTEVVLVGGAAVAGLALLQRKRGTAGASAPGVTAGAVAPGTMPAAAVVSGGGGGYSSDAFSAYNALQDEIGTLARQNEAARQTSAGGSGVGTVPAPIASTLFNPTGSGTYAQYANGTVAEVESDGSQLGLGYAQWEPLRAAGAHPTIVIPGAAPVGRYFQSDTNLANVGKDPSAP
jgi:hypothetical protein